MHMRIVRQWEKQLKQSDKDRNEHIKKIIQGGNSIEQ